MIPQMTFLAATARVCLTAGGSPSPGVIEASGAHLEPPSGGAVKPVFQELNLRLIFTLRPEFSED